MFGHAGLILIVDDDPDFSKWLASYLEAHDYIVLEAYGDREGVSLARTERPDLVIMGATARARIEETNTIEEIRRVPDLGDVPILVVDSIRDGEADLSGSTARDRRDKADCLTRPQHMPDLLERIREKLQARPMPTAIPTEGPPEK